MKTAVFICQKAFFAVFFQISMIYLKISELFLKIFVYNNRNKIILRRQNMKKILTVFFAVILASALCLCSFAYNKEEATLKADSLNTLGLFNGTENGYELDKPLSRIEALIMLIRLSGNEMNALYPEQELSHPFTDAPEWEDASLYMAYGYTNKLTNGISETLFAPDERASLQMYVTYVLRALGYKDTEAGSVWDNWIFLGEYAGILPETVDRENFLRGDAVIISRAALDAKMCDSETTLKETLIENYAISEFSLAIVEAGEGKVITPDSSLSDIMAKIYYGVEGIHTRSLMTMSFEITDDKYLMTGEEMPKEDFLAYLAGFIGADAEKIGVTEVLVCEPMMTSSAHSVSLIKVKDGIDIEMAKEEIRNNVNPRKWICVGVDPLNVRVENIGNLILLAMDNTCVDELVSNFRSLDSTLVSPDANGYLYIDGQYIEAEDSFNIGSAKKFAEKLNTLRADYFPENKVFYATIPEKSWFAKARTTHFLNHDSVTAFLSDALYDWEAIDIASVLTLGDYYTTDRHWRQEELFPVMNLLGEKMGFVIHSDGYESKVFEGYKGDYSKKIPDITAESLIYMSNDAIKTATVDNYQDTYSKNKVTTVYNEAKLTSKTPYDVFLSGATPLTTIKNPANTSGRRLIMFRDSYGSSIAPLFVEAYSEIVLVDLRYMNSSLLPQFVNFENAEVLFLVSDSIVNNSTLLK